MAVKIRLKRLGQKKKAFYRIVVAESSTPRNGRTIEDIGTYDSVSTPKSVKLDLERVKYWVSVGAQPTDTVQRLINEQDPENAKKRKFVPKDKKVSEKASKSASKGADSQAEGDKETAAIDDSQAEEAKEADTVTVEETSVEDSNVGVSDKTDAQTEEKNVEPKAESAVESN